MTAEMIREVLERRSERERRDHDEVGRSDLLADIPDVLPHAIQMLGMRGRAGVVAQLPQQDEGGQQQENPPHRQLGDEPEETQQHGDEGGDDPRERVPFDGDQPPQARSSHG